jgi:hypothetical protein
MHWRSMTGWRARARAVASTTRRLFGDSSPGVVRRRPLVALRAALLAVATTQLFRLPLPTAERVLTPRRRRPRRPSGPAAALWAADVGLRVVRWPIRPSCLHRGVVRYHLLRRAGVDVQLVFGAGQVDSAPAAHCWLLLEGEPYLETTDPRLLFTSMYTMGAQRAPDHTPAERTWRRSGGHLAAVTDPPSIEGPERIWAGKFTSMG